VIHRWFNICVCLWGCAVLARAESSISEGASSHELELPAITIRGKRPSRRARDSEFSGTSVDIAGASENSLGSALGRLPALAPRSSLGESAAPEFLIRAQDPGQSRYFLNGIPLTDAEYNQAQINYVPLPSVKTVDVYAEGAPAFLAADGLGGAVNLLTEEPTAVGPARVGTRLGSFGYARVFGRAAVRSPAPATLAIELTRSNESFNFYDDNGTPFNVSDDSIKPRGNNGFHRATLLPRVSLLKKARHELSAFNLSTITRNEIPGAVAAPLVGVLNETYMLGALQYRGDWGSGLRNRSDIFVRYVRSRLDATDGSPGLVPASAQDVALGARYEMVYAPREEVEATFLTGLDGEAFDVDLPGVPSDNTQKRRWAVPIALSARWNAGPVVIKPAVVGHYYQYALGGQSTFVNGPFAAEASRSFGLVSPRLGVSGELLSGIRWRATAGQYYRAPSMYELYGAPNGVTPSRGLRNETAFKTDAGVDCEWKFRQGLVAAARVSYTYYFTSARDVITYIPNSPATRVALNIGRAEIHGQEVSAELDTTWSVRLKTGASLIWTQNLSDVDSQRGKELPGRPPYRVVAGLSYDSDRFDVGYQSAWNGATYWDLSNAKRLSPISDHGVYVTVRPKGWGTWNLEIKNIFDTITAASQYGAVSIVDNTTGYFGYPAPGRRFYLSWKYDIG
jgi:outer membrane receptor protein involved in Fe transport